MATDPGQRPSPPNIAGGPPDDRTVIGPGTTSSGIEDTLWSPGRLGGGHQWIGRTLGRYHITGLLGGGGMGVVYRARDEIIEREVALKVLPPDLAGDPSSLTRFLTEAKAAGRLSHPNAVALYEVGEQEGTHFLVMELVGGGSLSEEVRRIGPLSPVAATRAITDAARGLAAAHAGGLVHRDIKPANLLRTTDGHVKVCDFGLAKDSLSDRGGVTKAGHVVGTPYYMSPEQCEGRPIDPRSDVYSLGATYYFLLTGVEPYADAGSTMQVMFAHCHGDPLDPRALNGLVPEECAAIVRRAAAKAPGDRYASAGEMLRDLERALAGLSGVKSDSHMRLGLSGAQGSGLRTATASAMTQAAPAAVAAPASAAGGKGRWLAAVGGAVVLAAIVGGVVWAMRDPGGTPSGTDKTLSTQQASAVASGAAVSGTAGSPAGETSTEKPAAPAAAGEPIKVGILHSLSGTMANSESPVVDAELLAIDEINRAGGVLGRPLEAVIADGRSDPQVFLREAERLIDTEKVPVVFGCWTSAARKTVVPLFEERDHLLVYPAQNEGLAESPPVLYTGTVPNQQIFPAIRWAAETLKAKRFFIVGTDSVFPRATAAILKDAAPGLGIEIVGEEYLPYAARSASAVASFIAAEKPDVILNLISGDANYLFFTALRRAEVKPEEVPTISFCIGEEELRRLDVSQVAGDYAAWSYFQALDTVENRAFLAAFRARYGPQRLVSDPMESAYLGVKLWATAANDAGAIDPRGVRKSLRSERMNAPEGPVRVDAESQHLYKTPRIGRIGADGRFEIVWSGQQPVAPEVYPATRSAEEWKAFLRDLQRGWGGQWSAPAE